MTFSFAAAFRALFFAYSAFCPQGRLAVWNCEWCIAGGSNATVVQNASAGTYGYVAVDKANSTIVVAFRGSANVANWLLDLTADQVQPYAGFANVSVHQGFYDAYQSVAPQVVAAVAAAVQSCPQCDKLLATGHSLGAAMTTVAAFELSAAYPQLAVTLINFGSPRVGNAGFAAEFVRRVGASWRCVHYRDLVPNVPPQVWYPSFFEHVATEVWWTTEAGDPKKTFKICNGGEDPTCSDSIYPWLYNPSDHDIYLGVHNDNCGKDF